MSTLEDKILGEKQEYYCSSEEEGEAHDNEHFKSDGKDIVEQGAEGFTNPEVCPPQPTKGNRAQISTNTGPKGVVQDWQRFKQLQAEKREENERQQIELAKKLTMATSTTQEDEERKRQEEIDGELAELMCEDYLQQFRKERISEMLRLSGQTKTFGKVQTLCTHGDFLDCVEKENKHTTVIIHIYERGISACTTLNKCLDTMAEEYSSIKFAKICTSVAGMSRDFRAKGLPALLVYRGQVLIGNFVRLTDELSDDFFTSDVESFLIENGIMIEKTLYS